MTTFKGSASLQKGGLWGRSLLYGRPSGWSIGLRADAPSDDLPRVPQWARMGAQEKASTGRMGTVPLLSSVQVALSEKPAAVAIAVRRRGA